MLSIVDDYCFQIFEISESELLSIDIICLKNQ